MEIKFVPNWGFFLFFGPSQKHNYLICKQILDLLADSKAESLYSNFGIFITVTVFCKSTIPPNIS